MRVAIYAMGGGWGHVMRALALCRAVLREEPRAHCRLLVPERALRLCDEVVVRGEPCAATEPTAMRRWVVDVLAEEPPDVLVVDVFPRGVLGELADVLPTLAPRRVLLTRHVDPGFYAAPEIRDALQAYETVIWTEPPSARVDGPRVFETAPVLYVRPDEVLDRHAARAALSLPADARALLVLGSGDASHQSRTLSNIDALAERLPEWQVRYASLDLEPRRRLFPAGRLLRAFDAVLSAAGYQSYYELAQCGVPALLTPIPKRVDDQARRARGEMTVRCDPSWIVHRPDDVVEALREAPTAGPGTPIHGADEAASILLSRMQ